MGFLNERQLHFGPSATIAAGLPPDFAIPFSVAQDAFNRRQNLSHAVFQGLTRQRFPETPGYDPLPDVKGTRYEALLPELITSRSRAELLDRMRRIDEELRDQELTQHLTLGQGFVHSALSAAKDPLAIALMLMTSPPASGLARGMMAGALGGLTEAAVSEAVLQHEQLTRTREETLLNIGGGFLLGGTLGGMTGHLSRNAQVRLAETLEDDLELGPRTREAFAQRPARDPLDATDQAGDFLATSGHIGRKAKVVERFEEVARIAPDQLTPIMLHNIRSMVKVLPDEIVERIELRITDSGFSPDGRVAEFDPWNDMVQVFLGGHRGRRGPASLTTMEPQPATVADIFAHEIGHRVLTNFLDAAEFGEAATIYHRFQRATGDDYRDSFDEWFANIVSEHFVRRLREPTSPAAARQPLAPGDDGRLMRVVRAVLQRIDDFIRRLAGEPDIDLSYEEVVDNFLSRTFADITAQQRRPVRDLDAIDERVDVSARITRDLQEVQGIRPLRAAYARSIDRRFAQRPLNAGRGPAIPDDGSRIAPTGTGIERAIEKTSPVLRLVQSPSPQVNRVAESLIETPFWLNKNHRGIASDAPVEALAKGWSYGLAERLRLVTHQFAEYRRRLSGDVREGDLRTVAGALASDALGAVARSRTPQSPLNLGEFRRAVAAAMRDGDAHAVPEVARTAKAMRQLLDEMTAEAQAVGLLPEELNPAPNRSFLPRMWNQAKILGREDELAQRIIDWQRRNRHLLPDELKELLADGRGHFAHVRAQVDQLLSTANGLEGLDKAAASPKGIFKERTIFVEDRVVDEFLENDIDMVMRQWVRNAAVDIELARKFGSVEMRHQLAAIKRDYDRMIAAGGDAAALEKRYEADRRDLIAMRDILRGVYNIPDFPYAPASVAARLALEFNNLTMLGGVVMASLPDVGRLVMRSGMEGTLPMLRALVTDIKTWKLAAKEAQLAGTALDMQLQTRALALFHTGDLPGRFTGVERAVGYLSNGWFLLNLLSPWNAFIKQAAGAATGHRFVQDMRRLTAGTLSDKKRTGLASLGIDAAKAQAILRMVDVHGEEVSGLMLVNSHLWGDKAAQRAWRAALVQEVDAQIVTPGAGDLPLGSHITPGSERVREAIGERGPVGRNAAALYRELGKLFFQYKSFAFGASNRVLISGLQARDKEHLMGLMMMVGVGGMVAAVRDIENGRPTADGVGEFLLDGFDQSGAVGWFGNVNTALEAVSDNRLGVRPVLGMADPWGASTRWQVGSALGPAAGQAVRAGELAGAAIGGHWDWRDTRSLHRFIPGNNHFVLKLANAARVRRWFEEMGDGMGETGPAFP